MRHRQPGSPPRQPARAKGSSGLLSPRVLANRPALLAIAAYAAHTWELYAARGWVPPFLAAVLAGQGYAAGGAAATGDAEAGETAARLPCQIS